MMPGKPKPKKHVMEAATTIAAAMVAHGAYTDWTAVQVAEYAIAIAETIFSEDIDGDGEVGGA